MLLPLVFMSLSFWLFGCSKAYLYLLIIPFERIHWNNIPWVPLSWLHSMCPLDLKISFSGQEILGSHFFPTLCPTHCSLCSIQIHRQSTTKVFLLSSPVLFYLSVLLFIVTTITSDKVGRWVEFIMLAICEMPCCLKAVLNGLSTVLCHSSH